jgi:cell division protease FtsH
MPAAQEFSEDTAREIDREVREIVARVFDQAVSILGRNRALLEKSARELLQKETLGEDDLRAIRAQVVASAAAAAA